MIHGGFYWKLKQIQRLAHCVKEEVKRFFFLENVFSIL